MTTFSHKDIVAQKGDAPPATATDQVSAYVTSEPRSLRQRRRDSVSAASSSSNDDRPAKAPRLQSRDEKRATNTAATGVQPREPRKIIVMTPQARLVFPAQLHVPPRKEISREQLDCLHPDLGEATIEFILEQLVDIAPKFVSQVKAQRLF